MEKEHVLVRHGDVGGLRQAELAHAAKTRAKESAAKQAASIKQSVAPNTEITECDLIMHNTT